MNIRALAASLHIMSQPDCSIKGSTITYDPTSHIYYPTFKGNRCKCRSAQVKSTSAAGILVVHYTMNPTDQWDEIELEPGVEVGRYFDAILQTGTTVTIADLTLFPAP